MEVNNPFSKNETSSRNSESSFLKFVSVWTMDICLWFKSNFSQYFERNQWSFLVPLIGGRWYIVTQLAKYIPLIYHCIYHLYIANWVNYMLTYHLLGEPKTTIEENSKTSRQLVQVLVPISCSSAFFAGMNHQVVVWRTMAKTVFWKGMEIVRGRLYVPFFLREIQV